MQQTQQLHRMVEQVLSSISYNCWSAGNLQPSPCVFLLCFVIHLHVQFFQSVTYWILAEHISPWQEDQRQKVRLHKLHFVPLATRNLWVLSCPNFQTAASGTNNPKNLLGYHWATGLLGTPQIRSSVVSHSATGCGSKLSIQQVLIIVWRCFQVQSMIIKRGNLEIYPFMIMDGWCSHSKL